MSYQPMSHGAHAAFNFTFGFIAAVFLLKIVPPCLSGPKPKPDPGEPKRPDPPKPPPEKPELPKRRNAGSVAAVDINGLTSVVFVNPNGELAVMRAQSKDENEEKEYLVEELKLNGQKVTCDKINPLVAGMTFYPKYKDTDLQTFYKTRLFYTDPERKLRLIKWTQEWKRSNANANWERVKDPEWEGGVVLDGNNNDIVLSKDSFLGAAVYQNKLQCKVYFIPEGQHCTNLVWYESGKGDFKTRAITDERFPTFSTQ